jgi:hypothetical protein
VGIIIFADFDPKGYVHAVVLFASGYDFLFKSTLGHCVNKSSGEGDKKIAKV